MFHNQGLRYDSHKANFYTEILGTYTFFKHIAKVVSLPKLQNSVVVYI